jgi:hypothetical protein
MKMEDPTSATQKGIHNHQNTGFTSRWAVEEGWRAASLTELDFVYSLCDVSVELKGAEINAVKL